MSKTSVDAVEVEQLRARAGQGHAVAQAALGCRYADGKGVPQDAREAARWLRLAAGQGHAGAQFILGVRHAFGDGVAQDHLEAVRWWHLAADQGHAGAQFSLGLWYANGEGIPRDAIKAVRWYRLAAGQGHAGAQAALERLERTAEASPQPACYAGPRAAHWAALQQAGWRCQVCGRSGILDVFRVGKGMDGGLSDLETLFTLCRLCQPRFLSAAEEITPVPWSAEDPRFEDVSGRTVVIDLDQLDTVSRGGGHGARTTVRYRPRRGGACFLLTSGYPFVCREIDRALEARNRPRLVDWEPAEPPGECLPPGDAR